MSGYTQWEMKDCIFCKIVKGEIPSLKVYEDVNFMAFLDINPNTKGHTLVVPKTHYRWTYDVPNFGEYFEFARKVAKGCIKGLGADWISFITVGLDVSHAHIHVIPRYPDDGHGVVVNSELHQKYSDRKMKEIADKIKSAI